MRNLLPLLLILATVPAFAARNAGSLPAGPPAASRHFVLTARHTLRPDEKAALGAAGVEIQQTLPDNRYIVRAASPENFRDDARVQSIESIKPSKKIHVSAIHEAAKAAAFSRVRLVFHDDVSFAEAQRAIEGIGGMVEGDFATGYVLEQRLQARIPFASLHALAGDDRVFAIYGPPLKIKSDNAVAAQLSSVTPLYSAPYGLTGSGVVLSLFELAQADSTHREFGTRFTTHIAGGGSGDRAHATHVAGTMIASGIDPAARGMAPDATLHEFDVRVDYPIVLSNKQTQLPPLGIVADNNSWGFELGWQFDGASAGSWKWTAGEELYGGYDAFYSTPYDKVARTVSVLYMQSAGNDGETGTPGISGPLFQHGHTNDEGALITGKTYCYSANGTGTDCPDPCSVGREYCETTRHPTYGPFQTIGPTGSLKNVISVGAVNSSKIIASFSSRGPTHDGRVKPDLVAKGTQQYSSVPGGGYATNQGTSMSTPVITGLSALLVEQWRKSFSGQNPTPIALKTLLIAGADDLGPAGPDYTYGFGLANAKASVDLIIADANSGSRVRSGEVGQGQTIEIPMTLDAAQSVRIVLGWHDPEVLLGPNELAEKTLVNDLDVKVIDPSGAAVMPYVLNGSNSSQSLATRGVNTVDNIEEVEIANAVAGAYRVQVTGTRIAAGPTQPFVIVANAQVGTTAVACNDPFEPNDSESTSFGYIVNGETVTGSLCSGTDIDFYSIRTAAPGPLNIIVTTTGTAVRVTLSGNGITPVVKEIPAGSTDVLTTQGGTGTVYFARVEPTGTLGTNRAYTLRPTYATGPITRRRATRH